MSIDYPDVAAGRYMRKHDQAVISLRDLFEEKANGTVDFKDPANGRQQALDIVAGMVAHDGDDITASGSIVGARQVFGRGLKMAEARVVSERIEMDFSLSQALFNKAVAAKAFWREEPEEIVDFYREFIQNNPEELNAA